MGGIRSTVATKREGKKIEKENGIIGVKEKKKQLAIRWSAASRRLPCASCCQAVSDLCFQHPLNFPFHLQGYCLADIPLLSSSATDFQSFFFACCYNRLGIGRRCRYPLSVTTNAQKASAPYSPVSFHVPTWTGSCHHVSLVTGTSLTFGELPNRDGLAM